MESGLSDDVPVPSREAVYAFVRDNYLHSRFEGRNGAWCPDYSGLIVDGYMEQLRNNELCFVSLYESRLGRTVKFDRRLIDLNADEPPEEIQAKAGHLTHILG